MARGSPSQKDASFVDPEQSALCIYHLSEKLMVVKYSKVQETKDTTQFQNQKLTVLFSLTQTARGRACPATGGTKTISSFHQ